MGTGGRREYPAATGDKEIRPAAVGDGIYSNDSKKTTETTGASK